MRHVRATCAGDMCLVSWYLLDIVETDEQDHVTFNLPYLFT
jgi:hypothetical protein